eukprot:2579963-Pleurochrysis_carterae.AAC.1
MELAGKAHGRCREYADASFVLVGSRPDRHLAFVPIFLRQLAVRIGLGRVRDSGDRGRWRRAEHASTRSVP